MDHPENFLNVIFHVPSEIDRRLSSDGWVADEFKVISQAQKSGAKIIYCIYEGNELPEGIKPWKIIDFRRSRKVEDISSILPFFKGEVMEGEDIVKYKKILGLYKEVVTLMDNNGSPLLVNNMIEELEIHLIRIPDNSALNKLSEIVLLKGMLEFEI
ncbi:hypothetical protein N9850_07785 [Granulosicoccus sp.]|nr:hypothetical protein [Granulosicoccus sp.]MDB4223661.1 hypothetical protein [Granulosicoccus sp.]